MSSDRILTLLEDRIGLNAESLGPTAVTKLIVDRMRINKVNDPNAYADLLAGDPNEFQTLVEGTVVVESWFFRGGELFLFLSKRITARTSRSPFRVLSIPCCTGEEPYSLAIALLEEHVAQSKWSILGVDLSAREIELARNGVYSEFSFRQFPAKLRNRYFTMETGRWRIADSLKDTVEFRQGNLIDPTFLDGEPPFDLIFCRNVMIYLTPAARAKALNNLERLLSPDGILCMGHSEPLNDSRFEQMEPRKHFLYQRKQASTAERPKVSSTPTVATQTSRISRSKIPARAPIPAAVAATIDPWQEAKRLADGGDIEAALSICRRLEASSTFGADGYHLMGVLHLAQGKRDEAGSCFRKALYLNPEHGESLAYLMHHHRELGDTRQADLYRQRLERLGTRGDA